MLKYTHLNPLMQNIFKKNSFLSFKRNLNYIISPFMLKHTLSSFNNFGGQDLGQHSANNGSAPKQGKRTNYSPLGRTRLVLSCP